VSIERLWVYERPHERTGERVEAYSPVDTTEFGIRWTALVLMARAEAELFD
jgi:hypothetical protein